MPRLDGVGPASGAARCGYGLCRRLRRTAGPPLQCPADRNHGCPDLRVSLKVETRLGQAGQGGRRPAIGGRARRRAIGGRARRRRITRELGSDSGRGRRTGHRGASGRLGDEDLRNHPGGTPDRGSRRDPAQERAPRDPPLRHASTARGLRGPVPPAGCLRSAFDFRLEKGEVGVRPAPKNQGCQPLFRLVTTVQSNSRLCVGQRGNSHTTFSWPPTIRVGVGMHVDQTRDERWHLRTVNEPAATGSREVADGEAALGGLPPLSQPNHRPACPR